MIQVQLKLQLRPAQERQLQRWLWHLTAVYNWTLKTIERNAEQGVFLSKFDFNVLLKGHGTRIGISQKALEGTAATAHDAWSRCFKGLARRPRFKSQRNRLNSISFPRRVTPPKGRRIAVPRVGDVRFHHQDLPVGAIKCMRIVRRSSGWYACLFTDAEPKPIPHVADGEVGIDPGFSSLLTLSTGEKIEHPRELERTANRIAQAQRGKNRRLMARLREHEACQRKDRNHKLSRRLVAENHLIAWSADRHSAIARTFGKSVASSSHGNLRAMLSYKSRTGGRRFVEVPSKFSTVTCSACGAKSGPSGFAGLKVRDWVCRCGASHDRDVNAAINTLITARGMRVEDARKSVSEIAN